MITPNPEHKALEQDLRRAVAGEVRFDAGSRAVYAADASNYRQVPIGVVVPRSVEDVVAAVAVCHQHRAPILARGGGTAQNGQCVNVAVVIDCSKYLKLVAAGCHGPRIAAWALPPEGAVRTEV